MQTRHRVRVDVELTWEELQILGGIQDETGCKRAEAIRLAIRRAASTENPTAGYADRPMK